MTGIDADNALLDFLRLSDEYKRRLTFDIYQLKLAPSYSSEHIDKDGSYYIFVGKNIPDIIQAKVYSRHVSSK